MNILTINSITCIPVRGKCLLCICKVCKRILNEAEDPDEDGSRIDLDPEEVDEVVL
jgi:hypothetical protein